MLSVDKRKSFSSVTVTSRVHPSVEHSENKIEDNPRPSQARGCLETNSLSFLMCQPLD